MTLKSARRRSSQGLKKVLGSPHRNSPVKRRRSGHQDKAAVTSLDGPSTSASSSSTNIKVSVRVRPPSSREVSQAGDEAFRSLIQVVDEKLLIFDPKLLQDDFYFHGKVQRRRDLNKRPQKDHKFTFDRVFSPEEDNESVFRDTTLGLVDSLFSGYNSSVFVYGATGAGKTFTMLGSQGNPGITFRTAEAIYERIQSKADELSCEVSIAYLEIYNENVVDLINPGTQTLNIREDGATGVNILGLTKYKPKTPEELLKFLQHGNANRSQHPTDANAESSRSHAIFQVFLTQKDRSSGLSADVKVAKLSMIDLAGSERGTVTSSRGAARKKEGASINKSLLALGNCINALAEGSKYIPFRNSKLTRILKDSLGGNCRTVMISNVSPSSKTYEDTYNTLKYAERAKKIKVKLKKNVMSVDFHIAQYAKIVDNLKQEISELKEKLKFSDERQDHSGLSPEVESLKKEIEELKKENLRLRKEGAGAREDDNGVNIAQGADFHGVKNLFRKRLELESSIKLCHIRMSHCHTIIDRTNTISELFHISEVSNANRNCLKSLKGFEDMANRLKIEKEEVDNEYMEVKNKFDAQTSSLKLKMEYTSQLETLESQLVCEHLYKFSHLVASERRKDNYLIECFLPNLITSNLKLNSIDGSNNRNILDIIDFFCGKKVSWDEDLIESSNSDSYKQLLGQSYADNVTIGSSLTTNCRPVEKLNIDELEGIEPLPAYNSSSDEPSKTTIPDRQPIPQEKEKHAKILSPTEIFDISLEEEKEEPPLSNEQIKNESPPLVEEKIQSTEKSSSPPQPIISPKIYITSRNNLPPPDDEEAIDMNSTRTINPSEAGQEEDNNLEDDGKTDMNSTQTLSYTEVLSQAKHSPPQVNATPPPPSREFDPNATHTLPPSPPARKNSPLFKKPDLNATTTILPSEPVDLNSTHTVNSSSSIPEQLREVTGLSSKNLRRETYSLVEPTVAVQPISQNFRMEKVSPRVLLTGNASGRPISRTPPALGTAEPRRRLNPSKSTSRLLTATDVRFGSSNGPTFGRPLPISSSSAPSYMASTAASSNRLNKQKENLKPLTLPSSVVSLSTSSKAPPEPPKMSLMRHLKRTLPKKT